MICTTQMLLRDYGVGVLRKDLIDRAEQLRASINAEQTDEGFTFAVSKSLFAEHGIPTRIVDGPFWHSSQIADLAAEGPLLVGTQIDGHGARHVMIADHLSPAGPYQMLDIRNPNGRSYRHELFTLLNVGGISQVMVAPPLPARPGQGGAEFSLLPEQLPVVEHGPELVEPEARNGLVPSPGGLTQREWDLLHPAPDPLPEPAAPELTSTPLGDESLRRVLGDNTTAPQTGWTSPGLGVLEPTDGAGGADPWSSELLAALRPATSPGWDVDRLVANPPLAPPAAGSVEQNLAALGQPAGMDPLAGFADALQPAVRALEPYAGPTGALLIVAGGVALLHLASVPLCGPCALRPTPF